ncbi:hypothetical protein BDR26DRAFT_921201 [Obelidium mucronatum]|nr:hypothetical protein BDR26DRAFT_921201 [Obelidium mucronatum]
MDIPGYYYDRDKNRYFKIMKNAAAPTQPEHSDSSRNGNERPSFITHSFVAKKMRREAATSSSSSTTATATQFQGNHHQNRRKIKGSRVQRRSEIPTKNLTGSPQNPYSLFSILRKREVGMLPLKHCRNGKDLVWEAHVSRLCRTTDDDTTGCKKKLSCSGNFNRRELDLSPWLHDRFVDQFDVHPTQTQVAIANESTVILLSVQNPLSGSRESKSPLKVQSSLQWQDNSKVTNIQFAQSHPDTELFVSSCLGGARGGTFQVFSYKTCDVTGIMANWKLRYRFNPTKSSVWTCAIGGSGQNAIVSAGGTKGLVFVTNSWSYDNGPSKTTTISLKDSVSDVFSQAWTPNPSLNLLLCGSRSGYIHSIDRRSMKSCVLVESSPSSFSSSSSSTDWRDSKNSNNGSSSSLLLKNQNAMSPVCDLSFPWAGDGMDHRFTSVQMNGDVKIWDMRYMNRNGGVGLVDDLDLVMQTKGVNSFTKLNATAIGGGIGGGNGVLVGGTSNGFVKAWSVSGGGRNVGYGRCVAHLGDDEMLQYPIRTRYEHGVLWVVAGKRLHVWS